MKVLFLLHASASLWAFLSSLLGAVLPLIIRDFRLLYAKGGWLFFASSGVSFPVATNTLSLVLGWYSSWQVCHELCVSVTQSIASYPNHYIRRVSCGYPFYPQDFTNRGCTKRGCFWTVVVRHFTYVDGIDDGPPF